MKNSNNNKSQTIKYINEDTNQIKKFLLILASVAVIAALIYFVTAKYLVKDAFQEKEKDSIQETISYNTVTVGTMFNRPYKEYYVFLYDSTSENANQYNSFWS